MKVDAIWSIYLRSHVFLRGLYAVLGFLRCARSTSNQPVKHWLGSSLSSEPRGLAGLSVLWHAGVLARSKISGSLLHRLSRPWHGLGPGGSHRDQRYGAAPKFSSPAAGDRSSSCLAIAASASSSFDFRCCSFILERRLAKQFSHDTKLLKLNQTRDGEACVCWSSLNDPRVR